MASIIRASCRCSPALSNIGTTVGATIARSTSGYSRRQALASNISKRSFSSSPPTSDDAPLTLHVETIGSSSDNGEIVFLHGLLGHGRNLKTFAKQVCEVQQRKGYLMDLRGHGKTRLPKNVEISSSSFATCVQDIVHTVSTNKEVMAPTTWVGHSWGGRMALQYVYDQVTNNNSNIGQIDRLWLLDVVPGQANESVERVVGVVAKLQAETSSSSLGSKKDLVERLTSQEGLDIATAQWLASSYNPKAAGVDFGFDLEVVHDILPEFGTQDFEGMLTTVLEEGVRVELVRGGKNSAWEIGTLNRLEALAKQYNQQQFGLHVLPKAGHWVHVDDLKGLVALFAANR
jgi:pimeloyl-ACP methyl ester carboxylesterase